MSRKGKPTVRKPATKFANLRKKLEKSKASARRVKKKRKLRGGIAHS